LTRSGTSPSPRGRHREILAPCFVAEERSLCQTSRSGRRIRPQQRVRPVQADRSFRGRPIPGARAYRVEKVRPTRDGRRPVFRPPVATRTSSCRASWKTERSSGSPRGTAEGSCPRESPCRAPTTRGAAGAGPWRTSGTPPSPSCPPGLRVHERAPPDSPLSDPAPPPHVDAPGCRSSNPLPDRPVPFAVAPRARACRRPSAHHFSPRSRWSFIEEGALPDSLGGRPVPVGLASGLVARSLLAAVQRLGPERSRRRRVPVDRVVGRPRRCRRCEGGRCVRARKAPRAVNCGSNGAFQSFDVLQDGGVLKYGRGRRRGGRLGGPAPRGFRWGGIGRSGSWRVRLRS